MITNKCVSFYSHELLFQFTAGEGFYSGVCFRMYTEDQARKLGVVGWVRNTRGGTVDGQVQGKGELVDSMKNWLSKVGSPSSRIDRAHFSNEKEISKLEFSNFTTRY
ncbi:acylphosphatase-2-like isoform X2 [Heptranchias perlo]|uniref:acylphosphatase-2-like isoform X2 n=1 Tax=Heptranchias perlo TaxID=212740 RepID=UPI00355A040A